MGEEFQPTMPNPHQKFHQRVRCCLVHRLFQWRAVPKCILPLHKVPFLSFLPFITVGQLLLAFPLLALFVGGLLTTFVASDVDVSGWVAWMAIVLTFLLANKSNSICFFLFGLSWEQVVSFHYLAAVLAVLLSVWHTWVAFIDSEEDSEDESAEPSPFSRSGPRTNLWKFLWNPFSNLTGTLLTVCLIVLLALSAFRWFRHYNFDVWLVSHILLSAGVVAFSYLHSISILVVIIWWGLDLILRYIVGSAYRNPRTATVTALRPDLVQIVMATTKGRKFRFQAGQFVRVALPKLGATQFHPATISSAPHENDQEVVVNFRVRGGWTRRLAELAHNDSKVDILVEGPYGSLSSNMIMNDGRYSTVLMVCGGIGVTPMISLARQLVHEAAASTEKQCPKIQIVWAVRDLSLTRVLPILPPDSLPNQERLNDVALDVPSSSSKNNKNLQNQEQLEDVALDVPSSNNKKNQASGPEKLSVDIFVTQKKTDLTDDDTELGSTPPPHYYCIHRDGRRPDMDAMVRQLAAQAGRIAVVACGPPSLVEATQVACRKHSGDVAFDFFAEVFEY